LSQNHGRRLIEGEQSALTRNASSSVGQAQAERQQTVAPTAGQLDTQRNADWRRQGRQPQCLDRGGLGNGAVANGLFGAFLLELAP
jgi:cell division septum initiation protein DivIVA